MRRAGTGGRAHSHRPAGGCRRRPAADRRLHGQAAATGAPDGPIGTRHRALRRPRRHRAPHATGRPWPPPAPAGHDPGTSDFAERNPAVHDAMFPLDGGLAVAWEDTPEPLKDAFAALLESLGEGVGRRPPGAVHRGVLGLPARPGDPDSGGTAAVGGVRATGGSAGGPPRRAPTHHVGGWAATERPRRAVRSRDVPGPGMRCAAGTGGPGVPCHGGSCPSIASRALLAPRGRTPGRR